MLTFDGRAPLLLSTSADRPYSSHIDLANQDLTAPDGTVTAVQGTINIRRTRVIKDRLYERIRVKNYNASPVSMRVELSFASDFADIFEVRGLKRSQRGKLALPKAGKRSAVLAYLGQDNVFRETRISFELEPDEVEVAGEKVIIRWHVELEPSQTRVIPLTVEPRIAGSQGPVETFDAAVHLLRRSYEEWERGCTRVWTDNQLYNSLLTRAMRDLRALRTPTEHGEMVAAGIPWFVAPFGRDALMSCHQTLMINPDLTRTTLEVLAKYQAQEVDTWRDAEPGKILHEFRQGELANAHIIPHSPYYGSVDSTPLWLLLLGTYYRWTDDLGFCRELLPNVERALHWVDTYGDLDGDGFLEYQASSPRGLTNQGWKDSHDSVVHADGKIAQGPIALAEVQAYTYMAKLRIADIYQALGRKEKAAELRQQAAELKANFNERFWVESEQYFAEALDGEKRQVASVTSNPAHGLYCDIVDPERAHLMARRLLAPDMFSGWGIRTLSKASVAYNPMSYHNGSIWPHDNAFIGAGLKRYGHAKAANRLATALFDMAVTVDDMRLPELFCGFTRRSPQRPVAYPVACSPQAWASGAPFLLLQAMLGISATAPENTLLVKKPHLPPWLNTVELHNLRVGRSTISVVFRRQGETTGFSLLEKEGNLRVLMEE
jgi:glycogen debranching enzyme